MIKFGRFTQASETSDTVNHSPVSGKPFSVGDPATASPMLLARPLGSLLPSHHGHPRQRCMVSSLHLPFMLTIFSCKTLLVSKFQNQTNLSHAFHFLGESSSPLCCSSQTDGHHPGQLLPLHTELLI